MIVLVNLILPLAAALELLASAHIHLCTEVKISKVWQNGDELPRQPRQQLHLRKSNSAISIPFLETMIL
jgi:hypothetical protein